MIPHIRMKEANETIEPIIRNMYSRSRICCNYIITVVAKIAETVIITFVYIFVKKKVFYTYEFAKPNDWGLT